MRLTTEMFEKIVELSNQDRDTFDDTTLPNGYLYALMEYFKVLETSRNHWRKMEQESSAKLAQESETKDV